VRSELLCHSRYETLQESVYGCEFRRNAGDEAIVALAQSAPEWPDWARLFSVDPAADGPRRGWACKGDNRAVPLPTWGRCGRQRSRRWARQCDGQHAGGGGHGSGAARLAASPRARPVAAYAPPTFQPATLDFGRVYAAYGGAFIVLSLLWGWLVDGVRPDTPSLWGSGIALLGAAIIVYWPRT